MAVNVVSATAPVNATGTSVTASLPSSILAGDVVIAFVTSTGGLTPTPPAGFTYQHEVTCAADAVSQRTNYYENFSVGPSDSGASKTFTVPSSQTLSVVFVHLRSDTGRGIKRRSIQNNSFSNVTNGAAFIWGFTNNSFENWLLIAAMSQVLPLTASTAIPTEASLTGFFGAQTDMRLWGYYSTVNYSEGQSFAGRYAPITNTASNGPAAITVVFSDKKGPADTFDDVTTADTAKHAWAAALTDGVVSSDAISRIIGLFLADAVRGADTQGPTTTYFVEGSDRFSLADALLRGLPAALSDSIGIGRSVSALMVISLIDHLRLTDTLASALKYGMMMPERVQLADALRRFFGVEAAEQMTVADALARLKRISTALTENATMTDMLAPKLVFRLLAQDSISLDDVDVLKAIYRAEIADGVEISAAYASPNSDFTTWAINARNGAITEYSNYDFTSFAELAQGRYVATADDGLYELQGSSDDGSPILSKITSGLAQINGSRFTGFKGAYLGLRGPGQYLLKIDTGDGKSYTYQVDADSMMTTKVNIGKGVRARYVAFELTTVGQDFDLDTVEFVPTQVFRRV